MIDLPPDIRRLISLLTLPALVGLAVGVAKLVQDRHGGWGPAFAGLVSSMLVACLTGLALHGVTFSVDETWNAALKAMFIGIASYVADDLLYGLRRMVSALRDDPVGFLLRLRAIWRGEK